jgi:2-alkenal reductase
MKKLRFKTIILPVIGITALAAVACTGDGSSEVIVSNPAPTPTIQSIAAVEVEPTTAAPVTRFTNTDVVPPQVVSDGPISAQEVVDTLTPLEILQAEEEVIADLYDRVLASTVQIHVFTQRADGVFGRSSSGNPLDPEGSGSGFVWDEDGHIITNHHVVATADAVRVEFSDGTNVEAEILGTDPDSDLAVLQVDLPESFLQPVSIGDSTDLRPGQIALAIGSPFGRDFTLTRGIVSALGRTIDSPTLGYSIPDAIQTDASINPGNSGGPLFNSNGEVIGINSQIQTRTGTNTGIGFAIPINQAKRVVPAIIEDGEYKYSYLGVTVGTIDAIEAENLGLPPNTRGARLERVIEGQPAETGGLLPGDIVTAIDGTTIQDFEGLIGYLASRTRPGDVVTLDLLRDGDEMQLEVELGERPGS